MYVIQRQPDKEVKHDSGCISTPIVTLRDEYGGVSHIIEDDHCYVLVNGSDNNDNEFAMVKHWYPEAAEAMKILPLETQETTVPDIEEDATDTETRTADEECRGIGWVIRQLRKGYRVTRIGWNGPGQYLGIWEPTTNDDMTLPFIYIRTVQGDLVPWLASQTDILAIDWELAETGIPIG